MATLKNILNNLENFADRHYQINDYMYSDFSNISTRNHNYPLMVVDINNANINLQSTKINFKIGIFDIMNQDYSNYLDISSDTLQIGTDLISEFFDNYLRYNFEMYENSNSDFKTFVYDDVLAGWIFNIDIEDNRSLNTCNLPIDDYIQPIPPEPFDCNLPAKIADSFNKLIKNRVFYLKEN